MIFRIFLTNLSEKVWKIFRLLLIFSFSFVILYPIIYMLSMSFRSMGDLFDPSIVWVPRNFTFKNFADSFKHMDYITSLFTTFKVGIVSSFLQTASCCIIAYGFARFKFRERNFMFSLLLLTIIIPPQVTLIPLYMMFKDFGIPFVAKHLEDITGYYMTVNLLDNPLLFYLQAIFGMGIRSGLYIFILRQFFRSFPVELEEAAEIDGCSPFGTFARVILPNAGSFLLTITLFSIVWYWNDYFNTGVFLGQTRTLAVSLTFLRFSLAQEMGVVNNVYESSAQMQAGSLLFILPILIMYIFMQRYFTESIERSGIVG